MPRRRSLFILRIRRNWEGDERKEMDIEEDSAQGAGLYGRLSVYGCVLVCRLRSDLQHGHGAASQTREQDV